MDDFLVDNIIYKSATIDTLNDIIISGIAAGVENHHWVNDEKNSHKDPKKDSQKLLPVINNNKIEKPRNKPKFLKFQ